YLRDQMPPDLQTKVNAMVTPILDKKSGQPSFYQVELFLPLTRVRLQPEPYQEGPIFEIDDKALIKFKPPEEGFWQMSELKAGEGNPVMTLKPISEVRTVWLPNVLQ